ncbi:hypothetical protein R6Q59_004995 [Mikania micrantha]
MAQAQVQVLVVTLLFCVVSGTSSDPVYGDGAWGVKKYYYYKELGEYAVACYNKLASQHDQLAFQKVIACDLLPGHNHKLTIAAADGGVTHTYEAVVCYKPKMQYKKLISFKLL